MCFDCKLSQLYQVGFSACFVFSHRQYVTHVDIHTYKTMYILINAIGTLITVDYSNWHKA